MPDSYDQSLLASAPAATKAQRQEGYNPDILNAERQQPPVGAPSSHGHQPQPPLDKEQAPTSTTPLPKVPFWRTTKGRIVIFVGAIVILGAIIGGAVGGTAGKNNKEEDSEFPATTSDTSSDRDGLPATTSSEVGGPASPNPTQPPDQPPAAGVEIPSEVSPQDP